MQFNIFRIGYFNGWLVAIYILLVGIFLYGILRPRRKVEWESAGSRAGLGNDALRRDVGDSTDRIFCHDFAGAGAS